MGTVYGGSATDALYGLGCVTEAQILKDPQGISISLSHQYKGTNHDPFSILSP